MRCRFLLSLILVIPLGCGCVSARRAAGGPWPPAAPRPAETRPAETTNDLGVSPGKVIPASYQEPETLPQASRPAPSLTSEPVSSEPLSLADLQAIALEYHPALVVAAAREEAARAKQAQAGLLPNPVIGYHATEIGNLGTPGQQGGFVSQRLITAKKLLLDRALAARTADEAHFQFDAQQRRVLSDVQIRFNDALVAQRQVELTRQLTQLGDELVKATQQLIRARRGTENDLLQAQIRADKAEILLANARNQHTESWRRLAAVIGMANMRMSPLEGEWSASPARLDWERSYDIALAEHPELNAARIRAERARIAILRARREPIPNIDVSVSVRHHNVTQSDVANVQVGLPVPVFDLNRGNIRAAESEWIATRHDVKRLELQLQDRLAVAFRQYANAAQQVDRYKTKMVPRAHRSLDLVRSGYEKGQVEYLTLLTAQQTFLEVNLAYLDSLRALGAATALIRGKLLTGSLDVP